MLSPLENSKGQPVDWWFMYKLPKDIGPKKDTTGYEFLYCDASGNELKWMKNTLDQNKGAMEYTLQSIFGKDPDIGYVLWNDENPDPDKSDNGQAGHTKGILAFSKKTDSGFYLLHSTPRFPSVGEIELPKDEVDYGQTYLCISLENYDAANQIAEVLRTQHEPQVYASQIKGVTASEPIYRLVHGDHDSDSPDPVDLPLKTRGGQSFRFFGKNKKWSEQTNTQSDGLDFWADLVGPALKTSLNVETWRRGKVFSDVDENFKGVTEDVLDFDLGKIGYTDFTWAYTKDHAKWGISTQKDHSWVIVADINRQDSQAKRGGGGLAFQNEIIWTALNSCEIVEKTVEKGPHKDST